MKLLESFESYINTYNEFLKNEEILFPGSDQLHDHHSKDLFFKNEAFNSLKNHREPKVGDRYWNYLNLKELLNQQWVPQKFLDFSTIETSVIERVTSLKVHGAINLIFINGFFIQKYSEFLTEGIDLKRGGFDQKKLTQHDHYFFFEALNQIFCHSPIELRFKRKAKIDRPVHFLFLNGGVEMLMCHHSLSIFVEEDVQAQVVETSASLDRTQNFINTLTHINVSSESHLKYCRIQNQNLNSYDMVQTTINLENQSQLNSLVLSKGGKLSRHNLRCNINGSGVLATSNGVYYGTGDQVIDHHTWIKHSRGGSVSRQLYKGVLDDYSKAIFNGNIKIDKDCQGADSSQLNKNLLLSPHAEINSLPEMDIYSDDVKATHGAAIGQMNEEEIFYLLSRGISAETSKKMIKNGFLSEVLIQYEDSSMQKYLESILEGKYDNK